MYAIYGNPEDENGVTKYEREELQQAKEASKKSEEYLEKACEASFQETLAGLKELHEPNPSNRTTSSTKRTGSDNKGRSTRTTGGLHGGPSTVATKSAANALVDGRKPILKFAVPSPLARPRRPITMAPSKSSTSSGLSASNMRTHAVATAAANTTVGYARGRAVSSSIRPALKSSLSKPTTEGRTASTVGTGANGRPSATSSSRARPLQLSGISRASAHNLSKPLPDSESKKSAYQEEDEVLHQLRMQSLEAEGDVDNIEDCLQSNSSDSLLLGDDAFEEFKFDLPPF